MRRSFKSCFYAVISNPIQVAMLIGVLIGLAIYIWTLNMLVIFIILLYLIPFCVLERTLPNGYPYFLSRRLTPMFYSIRSPAGRFSIVLKRPHGTSDCRAMMRLIAAQSRRLPEALIKAPGKYRAITHEYVLRRIERIPGAVIESARPVYVADMTATLNALTGGACKKCAEHCPAAAGRQTRRQFYDVRFTIHTE